jgi:hypothetical protein
VSSSSPSAGSDAPQKHPRGGAAAVREVEQTARRATSTCMDASRDRRPAPGVARLAPPLAAAHQALIVAQRTYRRLKDNPASGSGGQDLVATAKARVTAMLAVNYAIERHDPRALAISTKTVQVLGRRLEEDGRRLRVAGCH